MSNEITDSVEIQKFLDKVAGLDNDQGNPRIKTIVRRLVGDLFAAIEDLEINETEFWKGLHFIQAAAPELILISPGLGFDHFLDVLMDEADKKAGKLGGTPRTIEGPLYVENAPISDGYAEMVTDEPGDPMELTGVVKDQQGNPIDNALVEIWHASETGGYSHFDPTLAEFAFRRGIRTSADGAYKAKSIMPSGYAVPPGGSSETLLGQLGRHGNRPAHIHFFVSAPGYKHLTTQINIAGDPFTYDDFAFATRDELVVESSDVDGIAKVKFDLTLVKSDDDDDTARAARNRMAG
ncbi:dioxygenase [Dasania marina]|uniref:dioxygenase family protein n=1 Tax=Dasania marina TaxID=471499 RepID=UPI0030D8BA28|tara:strand:- start:63401 stop:64282 length:882 start_codon:yes stop_codon:yes gene_type:complete